MNFSEFSKRLHKRLSGISSQGILVGSLFTAAGSKHFDPRPTPGTDDTQKKLVSGKRKLTPNMKESFPSPIDYEGLMDFFRLKIGDASLPLIMRNFGIPETEPINKESFIRALCTQFQYIVSDASNEVDDIVASEYSRLLQESGIEIENVTPYYPGDDFTLVTESPLGEHEVGFYNNFEHQWIIKNNGQVNWENRYLECVNHKEIRIRPINEIIDIPKIKPGEIATLSVQFDSRGFEGKYESIWEMKDANGNSCFPDKNDILRVAAIVTNNCKNSEEA